MLKNKSKCSIALASKTHYFYFTKTTYSSFPGKNSLSKSIPAPNAGIITDSYEDAAIPAKAGLSDRSPTFMVSQCCTPREKQDKSLNSTQTSVYTEERMRKCIVIKNSILHSRFH